MQNIRKYENKLNQLIKNLKSEANNYIAGGVVLTLVVLVISILGILEIKESLSFLLLLLLIFPLLIIIYGFTRLHIIKEIRKDLIQEGLLTISGVPKRLKLHFAGRGRGGHYNHIRYLVIHLNRKKYIIPFYADTERIIIGLRVYARRLIFKNITIKYLANSKVILNGANTICKLIEEQL